MCSKSSSGTPVGRRPGEEAIGAPGVDDFRGIHAGFCRLFAPEPDPFQLAGGVGVGVDADVAARADRQAKQLGGRVAPLGAGVDLDRRSCPRACRENLLRIERRGLATPSDDDPAGAVPEDVAMGVLDCADHPPGHLGRLHSQLGVDAGHNDVEAAQQRLFLVQSAVFENVDFDSGQDPERCELGIELVDQFDLPAEPLGVQAVGDCQTGAVVSQRQVGMPERCGRFRHHPHRAAAVGPVGVTVAIALHG